MYGGGTSLAGSKEEEKREREGESGMGRGWRPKTRGSLAATSSSHGLFPGNTILEVNGERVKYTPVEKVVEAVTRFPPRQHRNYSLS